MEDVRAHMIRSFESHNVSCHYLPDPAGLLPLLRELIPAGASVGCGDSLTLEQLGVFDFLRSGEYAFLDKHAPGLSREEKREIYLQNFRADVFVSGVNAVTEDGKLIFIDGNGSRVAPILYGPPRIILIAGTNKLVGNEALGMERARQVAGPLDAKRLGRKTPCAATGICTDCNSPERICNDFVVMARQFDPERVHLVLVEGSYGY